MTCLFPVDVWTPAKEKLKGFSIPGGTGSGGKNGLHEPSNVWEVSG